MKCWTKTFGLEGGSQSYCAETERGDGPPRVLIAHLLKADHSRDSFYCSFQGKGIRFVFRKWSRSFCYGVTVGVHGIVTSYSAPGKGYELPSAPHLGNTGGHSRGDSLNRSHHQMPSKPVQVGFSALGKCPCHLTRLGFVAGEGGFSIPRTNSLSTVTRFSFARAIWVKRWNL